jgi:hypothetical protein
MRDFCILQWTKEEQILFTDISFSNNVSDSLSKPTGRIKFYEHMDILMGQRRPAYVNSLHISQFLSTYSNLTSFDLSPFINGLESASVGRCEYDVQLS